VKKATQAITDRKVPGGPLLIHKLVEARYRHHLPLMEAARKHSGLPPAPLLHPPPGASNIQPSSIPAESVLSKLPTALELATDQDEPAATLPPPRLDDELP